MCKKGLFFFLIGYLLLSSSCNIENRVMKNQEAFNNIGKKWLEKNPCANDSFYVYLPGKTDSIPLEIFIPVLDTEYLIKILDSIQDKYNYDSASCNSAVKAAYIVGYNSAETKWKNKLSATKIPTKRVDTIKVVVADKQKIGILEADVIAKNQKISDLNLELSELKWKSRQWFWLFVLSMLLFIFSLSLNFRK